MNRAKIEYICGICWGGQQRTCCHCAAVERVRGGEGRQRRVAALICVGPAARDFGNNDEVPLGERIEDYPPFTDPATICATRSLEHLGVAGIRVVGHGMQRGSNPRKLGAGGASEGAARTISEHETISCSHCSSVM